MVSRVRVSIVIPVYNGERTVALAIDSALAQRFDGGFEVIAVDDGSTDSTPDILTHFAGRIIATRQENRGPAAARNAGVRMARGEYIAFLDADDAFLPDKLIAVTTALDAQPGAVLAFHDAIVTGTASNQMADSFVTPPMAHPPSMAEMLSRWWPIVPSTATIRHATFNACGGFAEEFRSAAYEDPYLWILARERGEFVYIPQKLAVYASAPPLARIEKYLQARDIFVRRIRERYGAAAAELIRGTRHSYAAALGHEGLLAMRAGDMATARRNFARAWRQEPRSVKTILRLMRTFLPVRLARSLSGRTGNSAGVAPGGKS
jgi:glycosyltransferase involved in cell wall biosynthesis